MTAGFGLQTPGVGKDVPWVSPAARRPEAVAGTFFHNPATRSVALAAWIVVCLVTGACSRPGVESTGATTTQAPMRTITLPDLSRMDKPVQEQLQAAYSSLSKSIAAGRPPGELAAAYGEMGNLLLAAEYVDAAEPCYLNAQMLAPGESRWPYYLGHVYRTRGAPADAAHAFEQALALGPPDVATLVWLGIAYLDLGKADAAAAVFARALVIEPRSVAALVGQGRAALASHEYGRAADSFVQALSIDLRASILQSRICQVSH